MQRFDKAKMQAVLPLCSFMRFVVIFGFLLMGCAGAPKHPTWKNATGAEAHELLMWKAIREKAWPDFERHLSPTFIGVNASGQLFDRAAWVEQWKSSGGHEFALGEMQVQPEGPDMKVTYTLQLQSAGPRTGAGLRVVSVWQQLKSGWMLTTTSFTPILK
jgi:Domain of unknown function (DUF4440)